MVPPGSYSGTVGSVKLIACQPSGICSRSRWS